MLPAFPHCNDDDDDDDDDDDGDIFHATRSLGALRPPAPDF